LDMSAIYFMMIYSEEEVERLCRDQLTNNETFLLLSDNENQYHESDTVEFKILDTTYALPRDDLAAKSICKLGMTDDFKRRYGEYKTRRKESTVLIASPIPISYLKNAEWELKIFFRSNGWLICPLREGVLLNMDDLKLIQSFYSKLSKKYMSASNNAENKICQLMNDVGHLEDVLDSKEELIFNLLSNKNEIMESKNETISLLKEIKTKLTKDVKKRDSKIVKLKADLCSNEKNTKAVDNTDHNDTEKGYEDEKTFGEAERDHLEEDLKYFGNLIINGEVHLACMYCGMSFETEDDLFDHERIC